MENYHGIGLPRRRLHPSYNPLLSNGRRGFGVSRIPGQRTPETKQSKSVEIEPELNESKNSAGVGKMNRGESENKNSSNPTANATTSIVKVNKLEEIKEIGEMDILKGTTFQDIINGNKSKDEHKGYDK